MVVAAGFEVTERQGRRRRRSGEGPRLWVFRFGSPGGPPVLTGSRDWEECRGPRSCPTPSGRLCQYLYDCPPSIVITAPLMNGASPDSRKATSAATSWASPNRCIGLTDTNCLPTSCQLSGSICFREDSIIGVMIAPGAIALMETPN